MNTATVGVRGQMPRCRASSAGRNRISSSPVRPAARARNALEVAPARGRLQSDLAACLLDPSLESEPRKIRSRTRRKRSGPDAIAGLASAYTRF
jgi:hypothetical protein